MPNAHHLHAAPDRVLAAFLQQQLADAVQLSGESDLVRVVPVGGDPPVSYVASYRCTGLVRGLGGHIEEAHHFGVGIAFPADYLRRVEPAEVLSFLGPRNAFHPNISDAFPFICIGHVVPGTPLVELVYRCFDVITGKRVTMDERNALNIAACQWARENRHRFPSDRRPLKRRAVSLSLTPATKV